MIHPIARIPRIYNSVPKKKVTASNAETIIAADVNTEHSETEKSRDKVSRIDRTSPFTSQSNNIYNYSKDTITSTVSVLNKRHHPQTMKVDPSISVRTCKDVYPPSEDSLLLIEALNIRKNEKVLEIGCGSGIVSIHCARNGAKVTCGDINPFAVKLTRKNAEINNTKMNIVDTDLYSNIDGKFDTIIFNLPYLPVEDEGNLAMAWSGGEDGIGPLPDLLNGAPDHLRAKGRIVIVVSSLMDQTRLTGILSEYTVKTLAELPLFFEKLRVLEIRIT